MGLFMKPATRLDAVVQLRERDEDRARKELSQAQRLARAAESALEQARRRASTDERGRGTAADWLLADVAHTRALVEARQAEHQARAAQEQLGARRHQFTTAHARAEAIRRLAETRRAEIVRDIESRERKALDEAAILAFGRG
jgi:flagellar export protein FliJ